DHEKHDATRHIDPNPTEIVQCGRPPGISVDARIDDRPLSGAQVKDDDSPTPGPNRDSSNSSGPGGESGWLEEVIVLGGLFAGALERARRPGRKSPEPNLAFHDLLPVRLDDIADAPVEDRPLRDERQVIL